MRTIPGKPDRLDKRSKAAQKFYKVICMAPFMPSAGRYNITVCHEKKFIWFRVAKVGSRTIFNHLKESGVHLDVEHGRLLRYPLKPFDDYFKFSFVRNPWDRLVSCWQNKVIDSNLFRFDESELGKMRHFENFVAYAAQLNVDTCNRHLRSQSSLIDLNNIDYLGRMETYADDVNYIFSRLGLNNRAIVPRNVTADRKPYQEYYSGELAEKVSRIYRQDVQIFGYRF
jgi:hypothetical protein